ncbi:hypothetical protein K491DRAFT_617013 [Lophiostoma macrostomum CBS 122681]|uniref:Uncharacterized protein n=1 Tax=Lophiostoma macrostomum CBS 122681 TaxID=1314788 RepID=A0A6A6TW44_9PLEO|nr:hypothetical protein K491DRAFT_617013 [Lophiostoma macrostomum CBS 122681]
MASHETKRMGSLCKPRERGGDNQTTDAAPNSVTISPFLKLPREIRDQIYHDFYTNPSQRCVRIERRHLRYFVPTATRILLLLHGDELLLNHQIAEEALEALFKHHTVLMSGGPFVISSLLSRIEKQAGDRGKHWLRLLKHVEFDWCTFPHLSNYPPSAKEAKGQKPWWVEHDGVEVDVDYVRSTRDKGHNNEYDNESRGYDDNRFRPADLDLYPNLTRLTDNNPHTLDPADPFGFSSHYPFGEPDRPDEGQRLSYEEVYDKLCLLVEAEVTPLFEYLSSPTFRLRSITIPLFFLSKRVQQQRAISKPGFPVPMQTSYWVHFAVHALLMLHSWFSDGSSRSTLQEVKIKYMPKTTLVLLDPADDLNRMVRDGVFFSEEDESREGEGEVFKALWNEVEAYGVSRKSFKADVQMATWANGIERSALEITFRKARFVEVSV